MILKKAIFHLVIAVFALLLLAGCRASGNQRAPIEERGGGRHTHAEERDTSSKKTSSINRKAGDGRAQIYVIQKGDTLYSIAFENGMDYREVAEQNNIENPAAIQIGQQIRLSPQEEGVIEKVRIESKPLAATAPATTVKKDYPKIAKLPYSEQAVAQITSLQQESGQVTTVTVPPVVAAVVAAKPAQEKDAGTDEGLDWGMPTKGKVIGEYSESANRKGVDIGGNRGQAVLASESGKVVYSGSGLRGYGKLVIIKHNKTYLSAYAHNEQLLVKEGQAVTKGQKIAEMGSSDSEQVKLHFEIRKFGKPVDPAKFINMEKS